MIACRLTGSLALSIAYGIQVDTPDNEFFHLFEEAVEAANEALVPGAFLVDIIPPRESHRLIVGCGRTLTSDRPPQSGICLRGSPVYGSTPVQKK